jgi:phosphopentomutase
MGSVAPRAVPHIMREIGPRVAQALEMHGSRTRLLTPDATCLLVDEVAVVHDNMENEPGLNINLTANLDDISFDDLTRMGEVVRQAIDVARVIVVGGRGYSVDDMRHHLKRHPDGAVGIDTPSLGVYDEHYQVRHLGLAARIDKQAPGLVKAAGFPVVLIGKAADVVQCPGSPSFPVVDTREVFALVREWLAGMESGLVVANVQETDLAGHEQSPGRWAALLALIDDEVGQLVKDNRPSDVLIISGDHGNDPTIGHSQHTREYTPFLMYGGNYPPTDLGERSTAADVGATVAELFSVGPTEAGSSVLYAIQASRMAGANQRRAF